MAMRFGPSSAEATDYFFHCPRTGGNYAIRVINKLRHRGEPIFRKHRGHAHASRMNLTAGSDEIKRSFTIVRPPLDWYRSFYRFRLTKHYVRKNMEPGHPLDRYIWEGRHQNGGHIFPFDSFVGCVQAEYTHGYLTALFSRFIDHVDVVLSTDKISEQLPALMELWGYDAPVWAPIRRKNKTTDRDGNWAQPPKFTKWVSRGHRVDELPVDIKPSTLKLMERREAKIITRLRRIL